MTWLLVILVGFVFGALDAYLGTVHVTSLLGWWTNTVSGMSAPWLILPFLVGMTQERARGAALLGLLVTLSALLGYFWMWNGPFEGVPLGQTLPRMLAMVRSELNPLWVIGGLITGPLYGYFGHRWRVARSWVAAALVSSALCFEPLARRTIGVRFFGEFFGGLHGSAVVWATEVAVGIVALTVFVLTIVSGRRVRDPSPPSAA